MQKSLSISIIVPLYNQAQYIEECLDAVIAQTFENWECIIINDGSTDDSAAKVAPYVQEDARFRYIAIENSGVSVARNQGLEHARNEWILALDGDDKIAPNYLEEAVLVIEQEEVDIIYAEARFFGTFDAPWDLPVFERERILLHNQFYVSAFFKKSIALEIGGFDNDMLVGLEDWEFWLRYLLSGRRTVKKMPILGFYYRIKSDSRNASILQNKSKHDACKTYIYAKHHAYYERYWGDYQQLLFDYANTKYEQEQAQKKIDHFASLSIKEDIKRIIKRILGRK